MILASIAVVLGVLSHNSLAIPGKSEVYHILDSAESEWTWLARLSDRFRFNARAQKTLHDRLVLNYQRSIPKTPKPITNNDPIKVLIWNPSGFEALLSDPEEWTKECAVPCRVSMDHSDSDSAHIIMTTGHQVPEVFSILQPYQQKALFVLEPDLSLPDAATRIGPFHMLASYSRYSDIRIDYSRSLRIPTGMPDLARKRSLLSTGKALAAAFLSNCDTNGDARYRLDYLRELSVHMSVDSYGSCHHTPGLPTNATFAEVVNDYHFVLVFENSILDDYVTDKYYEALTSDAVPVYLGAPNLSEFFPDPASTKIVIETRHYPDPANLAKYLKLLAMNDKEYLEFFEWRAGAIDPQFSKRHDFTQKGPDSLPCRMCQHYYDRCEK